MSEPVLSTRNGSAVAGAPRPSPLQERVLRFVAEGRGHGVVEATAGSGKTTTLVQVAQALPATLAACFLAFNRATAAELRTRLPPHVEATTLHALGRAVVVNNFPALGGAKLDPDKYRDLALELLRNRPRFTAPPLELADYLARLAGFVRLATAEKRQPPAPSKVAPRHGLESPLSQVETPALQALVPPLLEAGLAALHQGVLDYTDMLYAPLMLGLRPPRYGFVCVDEAQDLSPLALALVMQLVRAGARALFVGDPQQAIYAFAGADSRSMQRITSTTSATVLPLSVSFRCPSRHVVLARRFSPTMQPARSAQAGQVRLSQLSQLPALAAPGDLIMSRVNAPLTRVQLSLAEAGTPSRVLGEDLAAPTLALARHLFGNAVPRGAERSVLEHAKLEAERLERELLTSPALAEVLRVSSERHEALVVLLRRLALTGAPDFVALEGLAHMLLGGAAVAPEAGEAGSGSPEAAPVEPNNPHPVILSTIHKAKGREANRVFLLFPEELAPLPAPRPQHPRARAVVTAGLPPLAATPGPASAELAAEANVLFVALTRARQEFVLVERTEGALEERLRRVRLRAGESARAADHELALKWNQVLGLATLMANQRPQRRWAGVAPFGRRRNRWL